MVPTVFTSHTEGQSDRSNKGFARKMLSVGSVRIFPSPKTEECKEMEKQFLENNGNSARP